MMVLVGIARRQAGSSDPAADIDTGNSNTNQFLSLLANPFQSQIQQTSFLAALGESLGLGLILVLLFCFLRPHVSWIYAPRARFADTKHAPPPVSDSFFGWWPTVKAVPEQELVEKIGLDATVFLRFLKMTRNIFIILTVIGCGVLVPATLVGRHSSIPGYSYNSVYIFMRITPQYTYGTIFWAWVILAYAFTGVIYYFLWTNYRAITKLRRTYFESADYRNSLHSRSVLIRHIPQSSRTEDGIIQIMQEGRPVEDTPNTSIARNVKELPDMIEEHEETVKELESVLARYLANPNQLPSKRPMVKPAKHDKAHMHGHKVDAIDYLTSRIAELEREINETRETVDQRNPLSYGFASYTHIEDAHAVAYATRSKGPQGTMIKLAPKPHDLIWKNLPMTGTVRRNHAFWNNLWMVLLTILYIPPNVLTAVFLSNLHNLAQVWPAFKTSLEAHPVGWGIAQGIVAPSIQILFFLFLPTVFRRLLVNSGDTTKNSRERHVASKLYAFSFFNKVFIFSVFAAAWAFIATVVDSKNKNTWQAIKQGHLAANVTGGLCNISPFWISTQLQSYLGAAVDILQAWPLVWNYFLRKFSSPTPRQLVELTAPQPFEYSAYYSNYLVILTVGLVFGTLQPLILPVTAVYLIVEAWFKSYMLQYIFITKVESGGAFWRMIFNRVLFATLVMDATIALVVGAQGYDTTMLYAMIPLLPILAVFKWYCTRAFDTEYYFYTTHSFTETETGEGGVRPMPAPERKIRRSADRVGVKFGHPALYKKLMTPMVHAKSEHLLKQLYRGRLDRESSDNLANSRPNSVFGYSDIYMSKMSSSKPGKVAENAPYEVVAEGDLDFANFKRRADFRDSYGGDGELYGRSDDMTNSRPSSMYSFGAASALMGAKHAPNDSGSSGVRTHSPSPAGSRNTSRPLVGVTTDAETTYARGYTGVPLVRDQSPVRTHIRDFSGSGSSSGRPRLPRLESVNIPGADLDRGEITDAGLQAYRDDEGLDDYHQRRLSQGSMGGILENASGMGRSPSPGGGRVIARRPVGSLAMGGYHYTEGGTGFAGKPEESFQGENTSYDIFRRGRRG